MYTLRGDVIRGQLKIGQQADFLVFNEDLTVNETCDWWGEAKHLSAFAHRSFL